MAKAASRFQFPLAMDDGMGRLRVEGSHEAYVAQLIRQVVLTNPGERIHRPDFGGGLQRQVFALNSFAGAVLAETMIYQSLDRWLGSIITLEKVKATARDATLDVEIQYVIRQTNARRVLNLEQTGGG